MLKLLLCLDKFHKQHREIERLVNNLEKVSGLNADFDQVDNALQAVLQYTKGHFRDEEDIMRSLKYPRINQHILQHRELIDSIEDIIYGRRGLLTDPIEELIEFFHAWAENHIRTEDEHLDEFIKHMIEDAVAKPKK